MHSSSQTFEDAHPIPEEKADLLLIPNTTEPYATDESALQATAR